MPPNSKPSIRLAPVQDPGAGLYNSYHYLTQLSGLYAAAVSFDHHVRAQGTWQELCDLVLTDLGDLYTSWEIVLKKGKEGTPLPDDATLGQVIVRACVRAEVLLRQLNVWTPIQRVARLLVLCERRWQKIARGLAKQTPELVPALKKIVESSKDRASRLTGLIETYRQEEQRMAAALKLAQSQLAKTGGGL